MKQPLSEIAFGYMDTHRALLTLLAVSTVEHKMESEVEGRVTMETTTYRMEPSEYGV